MDLLKIPTMSIGARTYPVSDTSEPLIFRFKLNFGICAEFLPVRVNILTPPEFEDLLDAGYGNINENWQIPKYGEDFRFDQDYNFSYELDGEYLKSFEFLFPGDRLEYDLVFSTFPTYSHKTKVLRLFLRPVRIEYIPSADFYDGFIMKTNSTKVSQFSTVGGYDPTIGVSPSYSSEYSLDINLRKIEDTAVPVVVSAGMPTIEFAQASYTVEEGKEICVSIVRSAENLSYLRNASTIKVYSYNSSASDSDYLFNSYDPNSHPKTALTSLVVKNPPLEGSSFTINSTETLNTYNVVGTGSNFSTQLSPGDVFSTKGINFEVLNVINNTTLIAYSEQIEETLPLVLAEKAYVHAEVSSAKVMVSNSATNNLSVITPNNKTIGGHFTKTLEINSRIYDKDNDILYFVKEIANDNLATISRIDGSGVPTLNNLGSVFKVTSINDKEVRTNYIIFKAGETQKDIPVYAVLDNIVETNESFTLQLIAEENCVLGNTDFTTLTITP